MPLLELACFFDSYDYLTISPCKDEFVRLALLLCCDAVVPLAGVVLTYAAL